MTYVLAPSAPFHGTVGQPRLRKEDPKRVKGVGEAGTIAAAPAVINVVVDALRHLRVTNIAMPASPTGCGPQSSPAVPLPPEE